MKECQRVFLHRLGFSKVFFSPRPPPQKERKEGFVAWALPRPSDKTFFSFWGGGRGEKKTFEKSCT